MADDLRDGGYEGAGDSGTPDTFIAHAVTNPKPISVERKIAEKANQTLAALGPVNEHIDTMWWKLLRTPEHLYLGGAEDDKIALKQKEPDDETSPYGVLGPKDQNLYIAASENHEDYRDRMIRAKMRVHTVLETVNLKREEFAHEGLDGKAFENAIVGTFVDDLDKSLAWNMLERNIMTDADFNRIIPRIIPTRGEPFDPELKGHGLLYVPHAYIVPGTRFNEMYGWDSAFVVRGLLQSGKFGLAKDIVDGLLYEVEHYGTVLNGNRTYYYDTDKARSQPPLLTGKIINIFLNYDSISPPPPEEKYDWLERAATLAEAYHTHWVSEPHKDEATGLSKYDSHLGTPSGEVNECEKDHYPAALRALREYHAKYADKPFERDTASPEEREARYYLSRFYDAKADPESLAYDPAHPRQDPLTEEYYKGDRAMRESGFDPSERFGFFNADVASYLPVCLNSLRFKHEQGLGQIFDELAKHAHEAGADLKAPEFEAKAAHWKGAAAETKQAIHTHLWDAGDEGRGGAYRDAFTRDEAREAFGMPQHRDYNYATAFFPMWVGLASKEEAASIMQHIYPRLVDENMHGLFTSDRQTGCQWDYPMMWPPLVVVAVEAMEKYGYHKEALQVATGFLDTITREFNLSGEMREKYEGKTGTADTSQFVDKGYAMNCQGFGWTNAAVKELEAAVKRLQPEVLRLADIAEGGAIIHRPTTPVMER